MARIRTIKPEFWESESVGRLSIPARLLFLASLNLADDEGLLRWNEAYISSQAFVYDEVSTEQVTEWMSELVRESIIYPYRSGSMNQKLGWIVNFRNHQVINRPQKSKLPPPSLQNSQYRELLFSRDNLICHLCGSKTENDSTSISGSLAASVDHITPKSRGGDDYPSNLKTSHLSCNKKRGDKPLIDSINEPFIESITDGKERKGKGNRKEGIKKDVGVTLEDLSVNHIADWLKKKRAAGIYKNHKEQEILEGFKDYCISTGKKYNDYTAALRNAFGWERFSPKDKPNQKSQDSIYAGVKL